MVEKCYNFNVCKIITLTKKDEFVSKGESDMKKDNTLKVFIAIGLIFSLIIGICNFILQKQRKILVLGIVHVEILTIICC